MQVVLNSLFSASVIFLAAASFALIFRVTHFFHFAHGVVFTVAAYCAFLLRSSLGLPLPLAVLFALTAAACAGCLFELTVYRRMRRNGASPLVLLLASLGLYVVLQNGVSMVFGDDTKILLVSSGTVGRSILGARLTDVQLVTICSAIAVFAGTIAFLGRTRLGLAMRAVSNDPALADVAGIDSGRIALWAFAVGSALAGLTGVLLALDVGMTPTMGLNVLVMGVVALIVGGIRSVSGIALGALLLGLAQHMGAWTMGSQWQDVVAFVILLAFLIVRPEGVLGKKVRKATV